MKPNPMILIVAVLRSLLALTESASAQKYHQSEAK
jgi:hypothetical protein